MEDLPTIDLAGPLYEVFLPTFMKLMLPVAVALIVSSIIRAVLYRRVKSQVGRLLITVALLVVIVLVSVVSIQLSLDSVTTITE